MLMMTSRDCELGTWLLVRLCLIPRTTVTSLIASKNTRCKTHLLCVNLGVPFWTREKTHKLRERWSTRLSVFLRNTRWRHGRSRGETKYRHFAVESEGIIFVPRYFFISTRLSRFCKKSHEFTTLIHMHIPLHKANFSIHTITTWFRGEIWHNTFQKYWVSSSVCLPYFSDRTVWYLFKLFITRTFGQC